jgi:hypothetical protein
MNQSEHRRGLNTPWKKAKLAARKTADWMKET